MAMATNEHSATTLNFEYVNAYTLSAILDKYACLKTKTVRHQVSSSTICELNLARRQHEKLW
jgi:hypothetical protein